MLGEKHPATLLSMHNLVLTYSGFGQQQEALQVMETVVAARKEVLGEQHPDTLLSMNLLADCNGAKKTAV